MLHQTRYELRAFLRNRQARYSTMAMPLILVVALISAFGSRHVGRVEASTYYVPGIATLAVLAACFANLVTSVTTQRESGVLKRRRTTPVPPLVLIAARSVTAMAVALATVAAVCAAGALGFGVEPRAAAVPSLLLTCIVGSAALCCVAYALSTAIHSADAAQPIVQAILLPLYFTSGVFIPTAELPGWVQSAAQVLPVAHLSRAFHSAFDPRLHGVAVPWGDMAVLVAWGLPALAIAVTRFRWTPTAAAT